ncbi:MAG: crossover junction endodeoxyribonuclease RuvC [Clostridia bacterium]|nr:crossover junction endodeoxyribonuclease RuvC [Clostridia bacterium]
MIILGIDPGYAIVGVGVIEFNGNKFRTLDYFAITTEAHTPFEERLKIIYEGVNDVIERYKPDFMAIEELFFNDNAKTAIAVGQARGVIVLSAVNHGVEIFEYTPLQVKQAVVGYGRAEKSQVQQMTRALLALSSVPKPDDVADALAIAVCHAHSYNGAMSKYLK